MMWCDYLRPNHTAAVIQYNRTPSHAILLKYFILQQSDAGFLKMKQTNLLYISVADWCV